MGKKKFSAIGLLFLTALVLETTIFQFSFWKSRFSGGFLLSEEVEICYGHVAMEDLDKVSVEEQKRRAIEDGQVYKDEEGFVHVSSGEVMLRVRGLDREIDRFYLHLALPEGERIWVSQYLKDQGNALPYQAGSKKALLDGLQKTACFRLYPYGEVKELYLVLSAQVEGQELIFRFEGLEIDGKFPFSFSLLRLTVVFAILLLCYGLRHHSRLHEILLWPEEISPTGRKKRFYALGVWAVLLVLTVLAVGLANPACRRNLAEHHAQYQELARAIAQGRTWVGEAQAPLLTVENPYDTMYLQAEGISYLADYAYRDGKYYVYFGIVPELLFYLPCYLLTGRNLPNYIPVLVCFMGFVAAATGLIWELMRQYFSKLPFYLCPIAVFLLVFGYPLFYVLLRPDIYHVPIAASCLFTTVSLWLVLAGRRREKHRIWLWGLGAFCMALNAGCRPQFLLFSVLLLPLCLPKLLEKGVSTRKRIALLAVLGLPYLVVATGIMYYNGLRFGSPFDFGASYSMTSNDMTHRGFNLERIVYSLWYYLFEPPRIEGVFPWLRSAAIETDYPGRLVSESCLGGLFASSMLYWPVFLLGKGQKRLRQKKLYLFCLLSCATGLLILAADATGAGILQRYMADGLPGIALACVVLLLLVAEWAKERNLYGYFAGWLRVALLLHVAFLFLVLVNTEGGIHLQSGNPRLFYGLWALFQL